MDSVTSFIYGMSMMFFSMMAFLFWGKGKEMLFRMIMWDFESNLISTFYSMQYNGSSSLISCKKQTIQIKF